MTSIRYPCCWSTPEIRSLTEADKCRLTPALCQISRPASSPAMVRSPGTRSSCRSCSPALHGPSMITSPQFPGFRSRRSDRSIRQRYANGWPPAMTSSTRNRQKMSSATCSRDSRSGPSTRPIRATSDCLTPLRRRRASPGAAGGRCQPAAGRVVTCARRCRGRTTRPTLHRLAPRAARQQPGGQRHHRRC